MKTKYIFVLFLLTVGLAGISFVEYASAQSRTVKSMDQASPSSPLVSPIRVDDFSYAVGQLTDASGGANVSGGNWVTNTGTGFFLLVSGGSLSYSGYPSSGIGNKLEIVSTTSSAEDTYRTFSTQTSGTTYAAFMVNVANTTGLATNSSTTGDYFAGFSSSTSTTAFVDRVTIRAGSVPNTYQLGFRATGNAGNAQIFSSTDLPVGTTALIVISYQIVAGATNDICNIWINPAITGPEPAATLTQVSASDNADVGKFFIRQGNAGTPNASIDGVRVGTTWDSLISAYVPPVTPLDFNGDGKTDWVVVRNVGGGANGQLRWFYSLNGGGGTVAYDWGLAGDSLVAADYDGDGKTDIAVWRPGQALTAAFYILQSQTNTVRVEAFGQSGDDPSVVGDYNGDRKADLAVYRPGATVGAQSTWFYRTTPNGPVTYVPWGVNGDKVAPGDYDGDGKCDFVVVRNSGGGQNAFWMLQTTAGFSYRLFGTAFVGDSGSPIRGDFDGDGKADIAIADGSNPNVGVISYQPSSGGPFVQFSGAVPSTDSLALGDYDGDGKTDIAVWRSGVFWARNSSTGVWQNFQFGSAGDFVPYEGYSQ